MMLLLTIFAWLLAIVIAVPGSILLGQAVLALFPRKNRFRGIEADAVRTVVLVPAHNEAESVHRTIESIQTNAPAAEILVIADNCTDETASVARAASASVVERFNEADRGKAFALGHAINSLRENPPDAVVVVDADAKVKGKPLTRVAALSVALDRPVQALNVIDRSRENSSHSVVSILGNRLHNIVRPLAMQRLGFPCLLMGSGMAFPWHIASGVGLENDSLGEDKQLGIDMMLAGHPPLFYLETKVASHIAEHGRGYVGQRTRWEQGHLLVALTAIPRLIWQAITRRSLGYAAIAAELAVPPIAVTAMLWAASALSSALCAVFGGSMLPLFVTVAAAAMLTATLGITWFGFARCRVPAKSLFAVPGYVLKKLPIYVSLLWKGPQRVWLRTDRPGAGQSQS